MLPRFAAPDENSVPEEEASFFAANLLVPWRLLEPVESVSAATLARVFGVSQLMMSYRLKIAAADRRRGRKKWFRR